MKWKRFVCIAVVSVLSLCCLAGCSGKGQGTVDVADGDLHVSISCNDSGKVLVESADDGFTFQALGENVDGTLLTGTEADVLNGVHYESDDYSVIAVGNENGFSYSEKDDKKTVYSHVFPVKDSDAYVKLSTNGNMHAIYTVEANVTFSNGAGE